MSSRRIVRVNQLLLEELASLLRRESKDPRVRTVTITGVETTTDLKHADVFVRTLGGEMPVEDAIEGLESAEGFLRGQLGRNLHLRRIPEFRFIADDTLEHARKIEGLLDEALGDLRGEGPDDGSDDGS